MYYSFEGSDWVDSGIDIENTGRLNPWDDYWLVFAPENGEGAYTFRFIVADSVGRTAQCETTTIFDETKPTTECMGDAYVIGGDITLDIFGEDPVVDSRTISGIWIGSCTM